MAHPKKTIIFIGEINKASLALKKKIILWPPSLSICVTVT